MIIDLQKIVPRYRGEQLIQEDPANISVFWDGFIGTHVVYRFNVEKNKLFYLRSVYKAKNVYEK